MSAGLVSVVALGDLVLLGDVLVAALRRAACRALVHTAGDANRSLGLGLLGLGLGLGCGWG